MASSTWAILLHQRQWFSNNTVSGVKTGFVHDAAADIVLTGNNLSATEQAISIQRTFNSAGVDQGYGGININATGGNIYNGVNSTGASMPNFLQLKI